MPVPPKKRFRSHRGSEPEFLSTVFSFSFKVEVTVRRGICLRDWDELMGVLLDKAKAETDPTVKHELLCEMQKIVAENATVVIPSHRSTADGISNKVKRVPGRALGDLGASEWPKFVWLESWIQSNWRDPVPTNRVRV